MVVSEYEDFLPAVTALATGLLEPLTMASAIAFSRLAGRPVAVEEVVVVEATSFQPLGGSSQDPLDLLC